jgi:Ca-activated chloride channel family protein
MPGEVTLAHQLGKDFMPVTGGSQIAYVLLETKPTAMMAQVRMPLNFALVLDHSGSMRGAKLKNVKEAVKMVIDRLEPSDYISVVIFDDTAQVIIPSMPANDPIGMKAAIDRIPDAGGTTYDSRSRRTTPLEHSQRYQSYDFAHRWRHLWRYRPLSSIGT